MKGIAALTSEFYPQNFFLLSFLFLLYVASLSRLPYILCITLFLVNAHIQARQLLTVPFGARNFTDFRYFYFPFVLGYSALFVHGFNLIKEEEEEEA